MNWYWPQNNKVLSWLLNLLAKHIWFKLSNANKHDISYWIGWTEVNRIKADTGFLRYLLIDSEGILYKSLLAYIFYFSVRLLWWKYFNYK